MYALDNSALGDNFRASYSVDSVSNRDKSAGIRREPDLLQPLFTGFCLFRRRAKIGKCRCSHHGKAEDKPIC